MSASSDLRGNVSRNQFWNGLRLNELWSHEHLIWRQIWPWGVDYTQVNSQLVHGQFNNIILRWSGLARISYPRWPVPMLQNVDECKLDKVDRIWKLVWKRLWPVLPCTDLACINIFEFLVWLRDRRIFYKGHVNLPQSFPFALSFDALWRFWRSSAFVSRIPRWSKMIQDEWLALTHVFHVFHVFHVQ